MVKFATRDLYTFYGFLEPPTTFLKKHPPGGENHPQLLMPPIRLPILRRLKKVS